jgi:adenylosuccinate lyase
MQLDRDRTRLRDAREMIAVCKLSGAVGTYSNISPDVERHVGVALQLKPVSATQVVSRDRHAQYLWACSSLASTIEMIAVELRHLQRTEVNEVQEGFRAEPDFGRNADGALACRQSECGSRCGQRCVVARTRHLALIGGAHRDS